MKVVLVRHSEPDYSFIKDGMCCQWSNLAPLTEYGIKLAKQTKNNPILQGGKILSSPYTRAFQTATLLFPGEEITIEPMLHEWLPDKTFQTPAKEVYKQNRKYKDAHGVHRDENDTWESIEEMKNRINSVINKYKDTEEKIIIVAHERIINMALDNYQKIDFCGIVVIER